MQNMDPVEPPRSGFRLFPLYNMKQGGFIILVLAALFYSPSINNEYALDDGIIIHQNNHVLKGVRGIKEILTTDAYHAFYKRMNASDQLQGGRYRPLPVITYAIEQEILGPYRSGYYLWAEDLNKNGVLDTGMVSYVNYANKSDLNYEFNDYVDLNGDLKPQKNECYNCWDLNRNFKNDPGEDLNIDGVFNEIDCQVNGARLRHLINILLYTLCCVLLYRLFSGYFFPGWQDLAFLAALLFTIHPAHSEVVANVKGRDNIMSLLFITLTFIFSLRYHERNSFRNLFLASLSLLAALLSKEYAIAVYMLIPLAFFVIKKSGSASFEGWLAPTVLFVLYFLILILFDLRNLYFDLSQEMFFFLAGLIYLLLNLVLFRKVLMQKNLVSLLTGLYISGIIYLCLRLNAVNMSPGVPDTEILNNPYLLASGEQAFATKVYVLLKYLRIFIFPYPLISDYSYATIPYKELNDPAFLASLVLNGVLLISGIILSLRRHLLGFALITYYILIIIVGNFWYFTGTILVESYLFHPAVGLTIAVAYLILKLFDRLRARGMASARTSILLMLLFLIVICGSRAWKRSLDWKNDVTLFFEDVKHAPNSVLVLGNAGARWIDLADTREITGILLPGADSTRFNDYNGQLKITEEELKAGGFKDKREAALHKGIKYLQRSVELHPRYVNGYLNLGLAYFKLGREREAIYNWKNAEYLYPYNPYLKNYYHVYTGILRERAVEAEKNADLWKAVEEYRKLTTVLPSDTAAWRQLHEIYTRLGHPQEAEKCRKKLSESFSEERSGSPPHHGLTTPEPHER